jgi:hypothetical protein
MGHRGRLPTDGHPGNLHFQYHYDFMPEGIITRFISRMYFLIEKENLRAGELTGVCHLFVDMNI